MNTDAALNRLITAWEAWDAKPGNEGAAAAMVAACRAYEGGAGCVEFRRHITAVYRATGDRREAIRTWDSQW